MADLTFRNIASNIKSLPLAIHINAHVINIKLVFFGKLCWVLVNCYPQRNGVHT